MIAGEPDLSLNGDMSVRVAVDTAAMSWQATPSGTVWRKRLHRVGGAESGQVTSIVRYDPDSSFNVHDHPGGRLRADPVRGQPGLPEDAADRRHVRASRPFAGRRRPSQRKRSGPGRGR